MRGAGGELEQRALDAHADAWQALGSLFAGRGGGVAAPPGLRLMASGLDDPGYNSGDVVDATADVEAARAFYAPLGVPWGLRVPAALRWPHGRLLRQQPLMGLELRLFRPPPPPPGVVIQAAGPEDLASVLAIDRAAFASEPDRVAPWLSALLGADDDVVTVALARSGATAAATGYVVHARGRRGRSALIGGVATLPPYRRRGIGGALSAWLAARALDGGAQLVQLAPDDDEAARLYARLGFAAAGGFAMHVEL